MTDKPTKNQHKKRFLWLRRMGLGAFLFFLIKGLIWLGIFFGLFKWLG